MAQHGAQSRLRGAEDFVSYYDYACGRQDSAPLPAVTVNVNAKGMLEFNGDRIKLTDWPPILSSISINKHLSHIAVSSTYHTSMFGGHADSKYNKSNYKKMIPAIRSKDMTQKLCKALRDCLTVSPNLKTLQVNGLPLRERDLIVLTRGLAKSVSLEKLSLANCPIGDDGLEVICQSVKYSTSIKTVDFTGCSVTWRGAEHMANIIKHQGMRRHGAAWAESLRYRQPEFEGMGGLRRITLNCNSLIGDRGVAALAHELAEDLWVKAVDLQKCGLSNEGARRLLEDLKPNSTLRVLDIRSNPLVDKALIKAIIEKVLMNADTQSTEYDWIRPPGFTVSPRQPGPKRRTQPSVVKGKATFRIGPRRRTSSGSSGVAQQHIYHSRSRCVPWRAAARAERLRGLPPDCTRPSFQGASAVNVTVESDSEETEDEESVEVQRPSIHSLRDSTSGRQLQHAQMELEECRRMLAEERRARLKSESRLMEYEVENTRLRSLNLSLSEALVAPDKGAASGVLEDESVLESIESSFTKFHAFLDLLKDAGLGQLATIAGIDQSDFQTMGRPQMSSTTGPPLYEAGSVTGGGRNSGDAEAKVNPAYVAGNPLPAPAKCQPLTVPPQRQYSSEELLDKRPLVHSGLTSKLAIDPFVDLEGGEVPDQYLKPEVLCDSGSEHSFRSQNSNVSDFSKVSHVGFCDNVSRKSRHHTNGNSHQSNGNSFHSDGSQKYSFNFSNTYSSVHSDAYHGNRSHGDLSARSSLSDMIG